MAIITYDHERTVEEPEDGISLLDVSLRHGIPHTHVCGGRARCSTCRVIVLEHPEHLRPRTEAEDALAKRRGFDISVRLACQAKVAGDVTVRRLVIDDADQTMVDRET